MDSWTPGYRKVRHTLSISNFQQIGNCRLRTRGENISNVYRLKVSLRNLVSTNHKCGITAQKPLRKQNLRF